jgi:hypothetical protein
MALVAGCASPAPNASGGALPGANASPGPASSGTLPDATPLPGTTQLPDAVPIDWTGLDLPPLVQVATLEATSRVAAGALLDTGFRLASLDGSDPVALAGRLLADPPLDLRVTRSDGAIALLEPSAPLRPGQAYRLSLRGPDGLLQGAWAVQAVRPLHVVTTVPGDESTDVPRDTGIEVTFDQDGVDLDEARRFIAIDPAVDGTFVQEGRTIAFAPASPLAEGTVYTVTVRHGLPLHGTPMTLERDVVFAFETAGGPVARAHLSFARSLFESAPTEAPVIGLRVDSDEEEEQDADAPSASSALVSVAVHRLANMRAAIDAWETIEEAPSWTAVSGTAPVDTGSLVRVIAADVTLERFTPDDDWSRWIRLPDALQAGWYVVTVTLDGVPRQVVLQVTDVAVYAAVTETRTLVWANDLAAQGPLEGATAGLLGTTLGRTDAQGLLVAQTPAAVLEAQEDPGPAVVTVRSGAAGVFVPIEGGLCEKCEGTLERSQPWWLLFQPDRFVYRSTDTIQAWGVVRDRGSLDTPAAVEVQLVTMGDDAVAPVATGSATPDRTGSFHVQLPVTDLPYGEYALQLRVGDEVLADRWVEVGPIVKPAWTLGLSTNRHAVISRQAVTVRATATFFEGTPVAGARIIVRSDASRTMTTNSQGTATARLQLRLSENDEQWTVQDIDGRPVQPEEGSIHGRTAVAVFSAAVIVRVTPRLDGDRLTVSGTVNRVALSRFEREDVEDLWSVNPYGAALAGRRVAVRVIEHRWVKVKEGSTYDFVAKRVVPIYRYEDVTRDLGSRNVTTDGDGAFRFVMPVTGADRTYEVKAASSDAAGRRTRASGWAGDEPDWYGQQFTRVEPVDGSPESYGTGDPIRVELAGGAGRKDASAYLWTLAAGGLSSWKLTTAPRLALSFRASWVPNATMNAVHFTGRGYEVAESWTAQYRVEDERLTVQVTPDRTRYRPGATATVAVRTLLDGTPASASVYLQVLDEKLYAMDVVVDEDPLEALYAMPGSGIIGVGWTHRMPGADGGGGGDATGGGGDAPRDDFRDWLVAKLVRTGSDGRAGVTFDLSDDLTSWRATASAVTAGLEAGRGQARLPVGLPFFVEATVAPEYLTADRPVIRVRGYGSRLTSDDVVTFRISSPTLPMAQATVKARAFRPAEVRLPKLAAGTHTLRIVASTGSGEDRRTDTLIRTFTVVTSRTVQGVTTMTPLAEPIVPTAGGAFTTLVLSDAGRGRVVPVLQELVWGDPLRADRTLAAALAARLLREEFGLDEPDLEALQGDVSRFQQDGGIAVVPHGAADLELTALAAMAGDSRVNRSGLASYLYEVEATTRERVLWQLLGRAALGEAVLPQIQAAGDQQNLTVDEQVILALAAIAAGDETLAGTLERRVLNAYGEQMGPWVRVAGGSPERVTVRTARIAIVAASLGDPVAAGMDAYVGANPPRATVLDLERALAARGWVERIPPSDASALLTVGGARSTVQIRNSEPVEIRLTAAQARTARLEPGSGSVLVTETTEQPLARSSMSAPSGQRFTRTIKPGTTVKSTDLVTVSLKVTLGSRGTEGCWIVTDFAPSGLVPLVGGSDEYYEEEASPGIVTPMRVVGQRVEFCVDEDPDRPTQTLRYVARVVTPGVYRWEASVLQSPLIPEQGSSITPSRVTIRGLGD